MADGGPQASVKFDQVQKSYGDVKVLEEFNRRKVITNKSHVVEEMETTIFIV